jgi:ATP-dependent DNA ligase
LERTHDRRGLADRHGIVSKHREHPYRLGPSKIWLKIKNLSAPGVLRFKDQTLGLALIT